VTALATAVGGGGPGELGLGRWHLRSLMAHGLVQCTWAKANQTKLSGVKLASHQMAANMATNIAGAKTIDLKIQKK